MTTLLGWNLPLNDGGTAIAAFGNAINNIVLVICLGLNIALHQFCINEFVEQCYIYSKGISPFLRSVLYYLLMSLSCIVFVLISFTVEPNVSGIEVSFEADTFHLLIVFGWVVYSEESRQTALEGFLVVRDCLFYGGTIAMLAYCTSLQDIPVWWWIVLPSMFLFYWLINCVNSGLQYRAMKLLNLLQDERVVSPQLLLTQQPIKVDINELEDIITDNQPKIDEEIQKFSRLLERAVINERERKIHENFASIVLTFKTAIQIKRSTEVRDRSIIYQRFWLPKEEQYFGGLPVLQQHAKPLDQEEPLVVQQEPTDEKPEPQEAPIEQGLWSKVLKYCYFPIYLLSLPKGRLKYLCYVLGLVLLVGTMLLVHLSCCYLRLRDINYQLIGLGTAQLLAVPKLIYFLGLPGHSDYDFCNIFLQKGIVKGCLLIPIGFILSTTCKIILIVVQLPLDRTKLSRYLIVKGATLCLFLFILSLRKMVARQQNFKWFGALYFAGLIACALTWIL